MLEYNEITLRKRIIINGEPYEVLDAHVFRMQQRKPQNKTKLKSLLNGRVVEMTFHASDKAEEAELVDKDIKFIYNNRGEWWFCDPNNQADRFKLEADFLGNQAKFLKPNMLIKAKLFDEKIIGIELPIKVEYKVTEAPPAVKGDTAKGGTKIITLENGTTINAPLFVNEGDVVRVNTETGDYVERV